MEKGRKRKQEGNSDVDTPKRRGRPKKLMCLEYRYPNVSPPRDEEEDQIKIKCLVTEMEKTHPKRDTVLQLMKATFSLRRQYILQSGDSVHCKIKKYPGLKMPVVVSIYFSTCSG